MDIKDAPPAVPPPDTTPAPKEQPLVELRWKTWLYFYALIMIIWSTWFSIFGAIIPYLTTGDFNEIWPAHKYHVSQKIPLFFFSWVWLILSPFLAFAFRVGVISFYETHVEKRPYLWFMKKTTIPYDAMHVKDNGRQMTLTNCSIPPWRENQYQHWKMQYWESIGFAMNSMVLSNPEALPQAIKLVRERAFKINKSP
jgi:hypothetical protein